MPRVRYRSRDGRSATVPRAPVAELATRPIDRPGVDVPAVLAIGLAVSSTPPPVSSGCTAAGC